MNDVPSKGFTGVIHCRRRRYRAAATVKQQIVVSPPETLMLRARSVKAFKSVESHLQHLVHTSLCVQAPFHAGFAGVIEVVRPGFSQVRKAYSRRLISVVAAW